MDCSAGTPAGAGGPERAPRWDHPEQLWPAIRSSKLVARSYFITNFAIVASCMFDVPS